MLRHESSLHLSSCTTHEFDRPYSATALGDGSLLIADTMNHQLVQVKLETSLASDVSLRVVGEFGKLGEAVGEFKCPNSVASKGDGAVFVVEISSTARLQKVSLEAPTGLAPLDAIGRYGRPEDGPGVLRAPCDVALHSGQCFVTDAANNRVVV